MSYLERYYQLMMELAQLHPCELRDLLRGEPLVLDGISFRFQYQPDVAADRLFLYCQYGEIPSNCYREACTALLEANLMLFYHRGSKSTFTISPEDGKVWLADSHALSQLSSEDLSLYLQQTVEQVRLWQQDHFLNDAKNDALPPSTERIQFA